MKIKIAIFLLILASLACNLERVLDPSLPTQTPDINSLEDATATPLPSPTPTPSLEARVEAGDLAFFYGDWDLALQEYQRTFNESTDPALQAAALLGLGRTYFEMALLDEAKESLETLISLYPNESQLPSAIFSLANLHQVLGNSSESAANYEAYLVARPGVIDSYVLEWIGDAYLSAAAYSDAVTAYQAAMDQPRLSDPSALLSKIGDAYFLTGDYQSAILTYQNLFLTTNNDYVKAQMDLSIGRAYIALEQHEQAYPLYLDAVENYPLAFSSYAALVELVEAGIPVNDLDRGLVDYFAASSLAATGDSGAAAELYSVAIAAFDRYLLSTPDDHNSTPHHYRALSLRALDDVDRAIREWDEIIEDHIFDTYWAEAYSQKAITQWTYLDDFEAAIETLESFVAGTPTQGRSSEFLFTAGRIAENYGRITQSAEIWLRVAEEYPNSEYAYDALFLSGINRFRLDELANAESLFTRALESAQSLEDQSQALFWIGKVHQALGNEAQALDTWLQTSERDPTGYYSERASDLIDGIEPFTPPQNYSLDYDKAAESAEAEEWIRITFGLPPETDLSSPGTLTADPRYQRGAELWSLGEYNLARAEFESLRVAVQEDPADSYRLANALIDMGLYRTGIFAARQVLTLAGMGDAATMNAPAYFNRLRFGTYFEELVLQEADSDDLDPLFIYSVMRQESLFEAFVTSSAGARGLMQIIPSTGLERATLSGWPPDFTIEDLYRPVVSIRLGTDYLAAILNNFDSDFYAGLAGYNGGPTNANYWSNIAPDDIDLYLEVISFAETRNYVRSIYELFSIYSDLYSSPNP
jgi:soluble lytic murein transglycosylase